MNTPHTKARRRRAVRTLFSGTAVAASLLVNAGLAAPPQPVASTIVARSSEVTAATGRRPISARIALARKPISIPQPPATPPAEEEIPDIQALAHLSILGAHTPPTLTSEGASEATQSQPEDVVEPLEAASVAAFQTVPQATVGGLLYPPSVVANAHSLEPGMFSAASAVTLNVEESQPRATLGDTIEWRLKLCNTSNEPVTDVTAVLYFAEGIEPVAAGGAEASLAAGEVRFRLPETLTPGEVVELQVTGIGTNSGNIPYRAEVATNKLPKTVAQDGIVQVTGSPQDR